MVGARFKVLLEDGEAESALALARSRSRMVEEQLRARGISDERVLRAMGEVPRHLFLPRDLAERAYEDRPLPIGLGQTISQPYIVAYMTERLSLREGAKVLDVGTGSGYQAAVLSRIAREVVSIEIVPELAARAAHRLSSLGYENVKVLAADGARGAPEDAPFDGILVACGAPRIPHELVHQLAPRGRLIIPIGPRERGQDLIIVEKDAAGRPLEWSTIEVRFVPLTGPSGETG